MAQPAAPYRVATLGADPTQVWDVFQRRLRELGYVEGHNLIVDRRWSSGYEDRLPKLMADLLRGNPDVIVTSSMISADTRIEAAPCVPILVIAVAEPYGPCRTYPVARLSEAASAHEAAPPISGWLGHSSRPPRASPSSPARTGRTWSSTSRGSRKRPRR